MAVHLQCRCGSLQGEVHAPQAALRGICYCRDCRAALRHLGQAIDREGGMEFVSTTARQVSFSGSTASLACLSLRDHGLLRWYASCCNTPIANTTRNWKLPYVGLVQACLVSDPAAYARAFPEVQMLVNTESALVPVSGSRVRALFTLLRLAPKLIADRATGAYRRTPFFAAPDGLPVVPVRVLTSEERRAAYGDLA